MKVKKNKKIKIKKGFHYEIPRYVETLIQSNLLESSLVLLYLILMHHSYCTDKGIDPKNAITQ
jgi:hypothetical protein